LKEGTGLKRIAGRFPVSVAVLNVKYLREPIAILVVTRKMCHVKIKADTWKDHGGLSETNALEQGYISVEAITSQFHGTWYD